MQAASNNCRKGLPPKPIDPVTESSQEIQNILRVVLSEDQTQAKPVGFWGKLFGKKSTAN